MLSRRRLLRTAAVLPAAAACPALTASESAGLLMPSLPDPGAGPAAGWTIAVFPDTQNYAKYGKNQEHFVRMAQWVKANRNAWNIQLVLHEGDIVEQNAIAEGGGKGFGDQHSESQWRSAQHAFMMLVDVVPVIHATGNHDYGIRNAETRETQFNDYFPLHYNPLTCDGRGGGIRAGGPPNAFGRETLENGAYEFAAPDGRKLLVISLEWGPRKSVVEWARDLVRMPRYRQHTGLLLTHDYLLPTNLRDGQDGNRRRSGNPHTYATGREGDTHDGEDLWHSLVRESPQIELVLNGHEMGSHVGYQRDESTTGRAVHQMLFNAQGLGGGSDHNGNGGDGWMRLMTFEPDGTTVSVRTFSPLHLDDGRNPYWNDPRWCFSLRLAPVAG